MERAIVAVRCLKEAPEIRPPSTWVCVLHNLPWPQSESEVKSLRHIRLFETAWTVAYQAPPSVGFSRQEYWSGLPFPAPGDLPNPGIEPRFRFKGRRFTI